jgi:divalent metal cation (Fe/Co/Zn/Cd) transporter
MTPVETANMILGIVISVGTIISITALGVRWLVKHYFDEIKAELKPNSGSSIKDQVTRLESRVEHAEKLNTETHIKVEKLERKIDDFYDKFIDYLSNKDK